MNIKGKQNLSLNNKLTMTLQIQLAIKLLQLNSLDLQKEIDEKILENPFLENENSSELTEVTSEIPMMSSNYSTVIMMAQIMMHMNNYLALISLYENI